MAITIIQEPKKYSGSRNPMLLEVETDNYVQTAGTAQVVDVADILPINDGGTMVLTIGNKSLTITFKTTPNLENMEVRHYFGGTATEFDLMIAQLNQIPVLGELFTITGTFGAYPQHVIFTQKTPDEENQLTIVTWPSHTKTVTNAVNTVYRDNYRGVVNVYAQETEQNGRTTGILLQSLEAIPDDDNKMQFEIQAAFGGYLHHNLPDNPTDTADAVLCPNMYTHYWLEIAERHGSSTIMQYPLKMIGKAADYLGAIDGGMRWEDWNSDTLNDDYFSSAANIFLTNQPRRRLVQKDEPMWLYFFSNTHNSGLQLEIDVYYDDGSDSSFLKTYGGTSVVGVYRWAVGYKQLDIDNELTPPPGAKPLRYVVKILDGGGGVISEEFIYEVGHMAQRNKYIVFKNMWGAMDTFCCRGEHVRGAEIESIDAVAAQLPNYTADDGYLQQYATTARESFVWNTGFIYADEMEWLRELAESDVVYIVENGKFIRVTVDRSSFANLYADTMPINGISIAMMKANYR